MILSPLRKIEVIRLLESYMRSEPTDMDAFVDKLTEAIMSTPEVVKVTASKLHQWNQSLGNLDIGSADCIAIAEIVLDAAAGYRGELAEEQPRGTTDSHDQNL
jgi:hypothetical protein